MTSLAVARFVGSFAMLVATVVASTAEACRPLPPGVQMPQPVAGRCVGRTAGGSSDCRIILSPPGVGTGEFPQAQQPGEVRLNVFGTAGGRVFVGGLRHGAETELRCVRLNPSLCHGVGMTCVVDDTLAASLTEPSSDAPQALVLVEQPDRRRVALPFDLASFVQAWVAYAQLRGSRGAADAR